MRRKLLAMFVATVGVLGFAPAAAATQNLPECDVWHYGIVFGEGVSVVCDHRSYLYRVVATCVAGPELWHEYGWWVESGRVSRAECHGGLLTFPARVASYRIEER